MVLSAEDKANVRGFWENVRGDTAKIGGEALERTFLTFPSIKTYFPDFDLRPGSDQFLTHGMLVSMSSRYPQDFSPAIHSSMDKFLTSVSAVLTSKYR